MFTLIVVLIILISVILCVVVLSQASKGDGLSGTLGGPGSVGAVFGVRRASDFLARATMWLGGALVVLCILANLLFLPSSAEIPNAVQTGQVHMPAAPRGVPAQSAPAVQQPAGAQPGTGQTNPDNSPMR